MASAVKPFVREAKQHFNPLAVPMSSPTCLVFSSSARWAPDFGAEASGCGPERHILGLVHLAAPVSASAASLSRGGPPIMPPSTKRSSFGKAAAVLTARLGDIALRSRKYSGWFDVLLAAS